MSKDLYKFGGEARQLRCQELDSFLHTLKFVESLIKFSRESSKSAK